MGLYLQSINASMAASLPSGKLRLSAILMIFAIIGIGVFQAYWLKKLFAEEWTDLKKETNIAFRDAVYKLQWQRFRNDTTFSRHKTSISVFLIDTPDSIGGGLPDQDTAGKPRIMTFSFKSRGADDSVLRKIPMPFATAGGLPQAMPDPSDPPAVMNFAFDKDTAGASLPVSQIDSAFRRELQKSQINVPFTIRSFPTRSMDSTRRIIRDTIPSDQIGTSIAYIGLSKTYGYQAIFGNPTGYLLRRMKLPISMALLLLAFITTAFVFLYFNLQQQQRLAITRDEFIGNMTHELKTPIATVQVAVEALRHFNALDDPHKTKEYLDISAIELQRLSILVDKVLRLSLFENKAIELNRRTIDLHQLAAEVIADMKLQFEKAGAVVQLTVAGVQLTATGNDFPVSADRMHMAGALSNLLDNALRYSPSHPAITVHLSRQEGLITLAVSDNGIGIPAAYIGRVFEKFFRVPSGDHHNIKGYGLGLSYVQHIITRHNGSISVHSKEGKGSTFTIILRAPFANPSAPKSPIA
jgi:two-component system phosphate regulon sensor histidine kinase PhoR